VSLMQSGDYDGISASGDATSRLIAGGIVAPVNTALFPNYANVYAGLKDLPHNTVDGVNYGVPHGRGPNLLAYLARTSRMYRDGLRFIGRNVHRPTAMLDLANIGILTSGALGDLQKMVGKYFKDERMQQSLSFQTLYLGLSPYESLAIYSLLPYVEIAGGIFYPMGGMFQLALALERLARELGVTFRYGARVQRFETGGNQVRSALLADGSRVTSDIVVANSDLPYTYDELLQAPYPGIEQKRFACSVVLMYIGTNRTWPHLQHHNFVVGRDMKTGCDDLFVRHCMPDDPPFYVVATSRTDPSQARPA